jgi:chemotaxis regulatin CheY-phosphate phosphatase CheZ
MQGNAQVTQIPGATDGDELVRRIGQLTRMLRQSMR